MIVRGEVKINERFERSYTHFSEKYKTCLLEVSQQRNQPVLRISSIANPNIVANINLQRFEKVSLGAGGLIIQFSQNVHVIVKKCRDAKQFKDLLEKTNSRVQVLSQISSHTNANFVSIGKDKIRIPLRKPLQSRIASTTSTPIVLNGQENAPSFTHVKTRRVATETRPADHDMAWQDDDFEMTENKSSAAKSTSFLDTASQKSKMCEEKNSGSWSSSRNFYKTSSDAGDRMQGNFGLKPLNSYKTYSKKRPERKTLGVISEQALRVKQSPKSMQVLPSQTGLTGFSNLGNTCYMNAILQSLFALESFAEDLAFLQTQTRRLAHCQKHLFFLLANLLQAQKEKMATERQTKCLTEVKQAISTTARRFSGKEQHDAHEFLSQVIDQVKEETQKENKSADKSPGGTEAAMEPTEENKENAAQTGKRDITKDQYINPTIMNFEFEVLHTITCLRCGLEVKKIELFHDLSLDLPKRMSCDETTTLQDALDQFFQREKIEYTCEKCQHDEVEVSHTFNKAPRVVVLQLKRYCFNTVTTQHNKLGRSIGIPRYLTLAEYCTQETSPPYFLDMRNLYSTPKFTFKKRPLDMMDIFHDDHLFERASTPKSQGNKSDFPKPLSQEEKDVARALEESESEKKKTDINQFTNGLSEEEQLKLAMERSLHEKRDTFDMRTPEPRSYHRKSEMRSRSPKACSKKLKLDVGDDLLHCSPVRSVETDAEENEKLDFVGLDKKPVTRHTLHTEYMTLSSDSDSEQVDKPKEAVNVSAELERDTIAGKDVTEDAKKNTAETPSKDANTSDPDWLVSQRKEQQDLDKAMELSLKEAKPVSSADIVEREEGDLKRAIELSLIDVTEDKDPAWTREESFLETPIMRSTHSAEEIQKNLEHGDLPYSYRLVSIVSHYGSSKAGHYISDVYNPEKEQWLSYNDKEVTQMSEETVQKNREHTGYIFFYVSRDTLKELEHNRKAQHPVLKEIKSLSVEKKTKVPALFSNRRSAPTSLTFMN